MLQWAKQFTGPDDVFSNAVARDASGNVYTTGSFRGTVDFDPGPATFNLISPGPDFMFVSKLDAAGNFVWAKQIGEAGTPCRGNSIALDASGNVYTTGAFGGGAGGTVDFDPGPAIFNLTSAGQDDIFVSKLDAAGNFVWAKQLGGTDTDAGRSIALDASGNVYTTGSFSGTADFDPGAATFNLTAAGGFDIFVSKLMPQATLCGQNN